jgi:hypothetical protein
MEAVRTPVKRTRDAASLNRARPMIPTTRNSAFETTLQKVRDAKEGTLVGEGMVGPVLRNGRVRTRNAGPSRTGTIRNQRDGNGEGIGYSL